MSRTSETLETIVEETSILSDDPGLLPEKEEIDKIFEEMEKPEDQRNAPQTVAGQMQFCYEVLTGTSDYQNIPGAIMSLFHNNATSWRSTLHEILFDDPLTNIDVAPDPVNRLDGFFNQLIDTKRKIENFETKSVGNALETLDGLTKFVSDQMATAPDYSPERTLGFFENLIDSLRSFEDEYQITSEDKLDLIGPIENLKDLNKLLPQDLQAKIWSRAEAAFPDGGLQQIPDAINAVVSVTKEIKNPIPRDLLADKRVAAVKAGGKLTQVISTFQTFTDSLPFSISVDVSVGGAGGVAFGGNATGQGLLSGSLEPISIMPILMGKAIIDLETIRTMYELTIEIYGVSE